MGQMRLRNIYEIFPNLPVDIDAATISPADEMRYENREMLLLKGNKRALQLDRKRGVDRGLPLVMSWPCPGGGTPSPIRGIPLVNRQTI